MNDDQLETAEDVASARMVDYGAKKRRILVMLMAYSAIFGAVLCFLPEEDIPLDFVVGLPVLLLGISWCFTDANERDHRIGRVMKLVLIFFFVIGLPIYLLQTRGMGAFKILAFTMLLVAGMFVCMIATAIATLYLGEATGLWELAE
jgi:hypothetical protein